MTRLDHESHGLPPLPNENSLSEPPDLSTPRYSPRSVIIALVLLGATIVGVLAALQFFVAQHIPDLTPESLATAEKLWQLSGPPSYDMDVELRGAQPGSVHIEVRQGAATAMTRDGRSPVERTWHYWTVPGRFSELERELELAEDPAHEMQVEANTRLRLRCEFDPKYGFPRIYHRAVHGGGPEVYWRVTNFEAL